MDFKRLFKIGVLTLFGGIFMANSFCSAHSIRTPEGNMPMVHWAVVESTPGGMTAMGRIAQETVGPQSAREAGTYALYGGVDAQNPDVMRLLEIYRDREAFEKYQASEAYQTYMMEVMPMFSMTHMVENMPGNIVLSDKGIHNK